MSSSITFSLILISITSALILLVVLRSFNDNLYALDLDQFSGPSVSLIGKTEGGARGDGAGSCRMAWMNPVYISLSHSSLKSRLKGKYKAYLYREGGLDPEQPRGSPVLFIPGNAGSFRQTRSFAAATAKLYHHEKNSATAGTRSVPLHTAPEHPGLDFFALDFNEDLSAFHGETLLEQAEYANEIIAHILNLYTNSRPINHSGSIPVPTSVLIVAHSMGGIVARKMIRMPNYVNGSINTIISISTPHTLPPTTLDRGIETVYNDINQFWRKSYFERSPLPNVLKDLLLVSISGSTSDTTVSPDSSSLLTLAPAPYGLTFYSTAMPEVWTPIDHRAVLWCDQLRMVVAKALLAITDARIPSQVKSLEERASILRSYLSSGHGLRLGSEINQRIPNFAFDPISHTLHSPLARIKLDSGELNRPEAFVHILPLKEDNSEVVLAFDAFTLLTNLPLATHLDVLACNGTFKIDRLGSCKLLTTQYSTTLPSSHFHLQPSSVPGPNDEADPHDVFNFINIPRSALSNSDFVVLLTSTSHPSLKDPTFLISEFRTENTNQRIDASLWTLSLWGINLPNLSRSSRPSLVSDLYLPGMDSSVLAFKVKVNYPSKCEAEATFAPLMRQQTPILNESKLHPNIHSAILYTHLSTVYSPIPRSLNDKSQSGIKLTFWNDPYACEGGLDDENIKLSIRIDWYESARKIILKYRTALVAMPLGVVSIAFALQIHYFRKSGIFPSLGFALSTLTERYLLKALAVVVGVQFLQSAILNASLGVGQHHSTDNFLASSPTWISGLLLGDRHPSFAVLDCVFVVVGLGWTSLAYVVIHLICVILSKLWPTLIGVSDTAKAKKQSTLHSLSTSGSRRKFSINTMALGGLILFTTFMAPYQFAFLIVLLLHLFQTLRILAVNDKTENRNLISIESSNQFHYYFSILFIMIWLLPGNIMILMVWIKNLFTGWYKPFSSDKNVEYVIGYLFWFWMITNQNRRMFSHFEKRSFLNLIMIMLLGTGLFSILYGIRYTFRIFDMFNIVFMFIALLHYNSSSYKSHSG
ncbi:hypothetical protein CROQUDRAFT_655026 [Cronartium quercuum f. sp. fusiforme G11]|uniref:GPI inositol-deacylase n=1 Tax=Cronartium quercuum f. sp. fusiforme G11 TaxID=708437 RepID=A0A9P6TDD2_9BASI|nr:hypothetical protein CROQUDRAFT_655026 [Cronartium quercuum f. sp. fusiforme G11]